MRLTALVSYRAAAASLSQRGRRDGLRNRETAKRRLTSLCPLEGGVGSVPPTSPTCLDACPFSVILFLLHLEPRCWDKAGKVPSLLLPLSTWWGGLEASGE